MRAGILSRSGTRIPIAVIISYVFDWVIIIAAAVVGYFFGIISPNKRPFSVADLDISFPYKVVETISTTTLVLASLVAPAVVILVVAILFVPGPTAPKSTPKLLIWQRKLWEWFAGWTGLALALVMAWVITGGMKNLFGHWRPDLLSRCNPDIANVAKYAVGGYINTEDGAYLVSAAICQSTDSATLDDGFRSFPSGHSSFSAAGLVYLTLFLASKLGIRIPTLAPRAFSNSYSGYSAFPSRMGRSRTGLIRRGDGSGMEKSEQSPETDYATPSGHDDVEITARNQAAAPPVYLLVFACVPFFVSVFISSTRYSDFRHHGFDILFGFFIGTVTAVFSFRWYHLPISRGAGWSWGPRSRDHAFWAGAGVHSYASCNTNSEYPQVYADGPANNDVEAGPSHSPDHNSKQPEDHSA